MDIILIYIIKSYKKNVLVIVEIVNQNPIQMFCTVNWKEKIIFWKWLQMIILSTQWILTSLQSITSVTSLANIHSRIT